MCLAPLSSCSIGAKTFSRSVRSALLGPFVVGRLYGSFEWTVVDGGVDGSALPDRLFGTDCGAWGRRTKQDTGVYFHLSWLAFIMCLIDADDLYQSASGR